MELDLCFQVAACVGAKRTVRDTPRGGGVRGATAEDLLTRAWCIEARLPDPLLVLLGDE
jgi:hypothetical protein